MYMYGHEEIGMSLTLQGEDPIFAKTCTNKPKSVKDEMISQMTMGGSSTYLIQELLIKKFYDIVTSICFVFSVPYIHSRAAERLRCILASPSPLS